MIVFSLKLFPGRNQVKHEVVQRGEGGGRVRVWDSYSRNKIYGTYFKQGITVVIEGI